MDTNQNHQFKVGIFLSGGVLALLASIFMLGADKAFFKKYVTLNIQFESVQGLNIGSTVSLAGLNVGNVEDIEFQSAENVLNVVIKIEDTFAKKITLGSQAEIRTQGALGDKYVYIIPGSPHEAALTENAILPVAKATDLIGIISERGKETDKIFDIINEVYKTTRTLNHEGRLEKIMNNLTVASTNLKDASIQAHALTQDVSAGKTTQKITMSIDKLERILTKIDKGDGTLGALINDPTIHNQLRGILGSSPRKNHMKILLRNSIDEEQ
jgi:phospholipid/cholesterol/gamma-HCH transport system substrate-binding protein